MSEAGDGPTLRAAGPADAVSLAALHGRCFARPWDARALADLLGAPGVFGLIAAAGDEAAAGFGLARVAADEAEILTLCVAPEVRRRGLGTGLVAGLGAAATALGARTLFLEVGAANAPAQRLYRSFGFISVGRRPDYYRDEEGTEDAEILSLNLSRWPTRI